MKVRIKFYTRNNVIQYSITDRRKTVRRSTKIRLDGAPWDKDKEKIAGRTSHGDAINKTLRRIEEAVEEASSIEVAIAAIGGLLAPGTTKRNKTLFDYMGEYYAEVAPRLAKSTGAVYASVIKLYGKFASEEGDICPIDYDLRSIEISHRAEAIRRFKGHLHSFVSYMVEKGKKPGTQKEYLSKVKAVLNWLRDDHGIDMPSKFPDPDVVSDSISLPIEAIKAFMQKDIYPTDGVMLSVYLLVKIQLCTALRLEDAASIKLSDILINDGIPYVMKRNEKTGRKTINRIHPAVFREIMDKGFGEEIFSPKFLSVSRGMRNEYTNKYMKQLFSDIPVMQTEIVTVEQAADGSWKHIKKTYIELLHNHMLRKSAITFMAYAGASEKHIKASSGHTPGSGVYKSVYDLVISSELDKDLGDAQDLFYN